MIWNYMMFTDYCWEDPFRLKDGYISRKRGVVKFILLQFTFLRCGPTFFVPYKTFPFSVMLPGKLLLFSSKSATTNDTMTCFRASSQRPDDATQRKLQMSQLSLPGSHLQTGRYTFRSKGWPSVPNTQPRPHPLQLVLVPIIPPGNPNPLDRTSWDICRGPPLLCWGETNIPLLSTSPLLALGNKLSWFVHS